MAFIAPLIGAALGLGAVGTAVLEVGLAFGAGAIARSLKPKTKKTRSQSERGQTLSLEIGTNLPRRAIIGRAPTGGQLVYWQCTGSNNETVQMVVKLADHECHGLAELWVDGKKRDWNPVTGVVDGFDGKLKIRFYHGTGTQTVDTAVRDASGGRWTDNERGIGVCYVVVEATEDETVFKAGLPQIVYVVDGAKLYDRRKDSTVGGVGPQRRNDPSTWTFSRNSAVAIDNVLWMIPQNGAYLMGLRAPPESVRQSDFEASANACDEAIALAAGGTEPRYQCGFAVDVGPGLYPEREALEMLIDSMAGDVITACGIYRIMAGVSRPIVATLTDADFVHDEPFMWSSKRPRTELTNAVAASFANPAEAYKMTPLPLRWSSVDQDQDGGNRWTRSLDLRGVQSHTQGQRIQEIRRREGRRQTRGHGRLRAQWFVLEPGDWVTINSDRAGWAGRTFEIGASSEQRKLTSDRAFIETDDEVDDWSSGMELPEDAVADLPSGGPTLTLVSGFTVSVDFVQGYGDEQIPILRFGWVPVTDRTVVQLEIEYRKSGDTVAMSKVVLDPAAGEAIVADGIQGGLIYQARIKPVTMPLRAVDWTAWAATAGTSPQQIVGVAAVANSVPPDTITPEMLDEMSRFLLSLSFAADEVFGSVNERLSEVQEMIVRLSDAASANLITAEEYGARIDEVRTILQTETNVLAQQIATISAQIDGDIATAVQTITTRVNQVEVLAGTKNRVFRQNTAPVALAAGDIWIHTGMGNQIRVATAPGTLSWVVSVDQRIPNLEAAQTATASSLSQLTTRVGNNEASVFDLAESIDGVRARKTLGINANGKVALVDIAGNEFGTSLTFVGDDVYFSHPSVNGGNPMPFLAIKTVGGVNKFVFKGQMITDSFVSGEASFATLSAIVANLGLVRAGALRSLDNKVIFDLDNRILQMDFD